MSADPPSPDPAQTLPPLPETLGRTLHRHDETLAPDWDPTTTTGPRAPGPSSAPSLPRLGLVGEVSGPPEYRMGEPLGRGATAVVYAAQHLPLGRTVAIKTLRPERSGPAADDALVDEARIACLEHPNIVPVHAIGRDGRGRPMLVMKRVEGQPWSAAAGRPDHPLWDRWPGDALDRAVQVALRVADALSAAHHAGVLHRDIKPSNVVLGHRGEVYLVDWGIAARLDGDGRLMAPLAGTPAYMAPEMFDETRPLDRRSDVYLLGATLYAALAGRPPHRASSLSGLAVAAHRPPDPLDDVPTELAGIVYRAMDPDPDRRFADIEALRRALVDFLDHRSALEWVDRADARRAQLDAADLEPGQRDQLIAEARFGYRSALDTWPDCAPARARLQALLESVVRADLARGDVVAARRALVELPTPSPALNAELTAAEARVDAERVELDAARAHAAALDTGAGRSRRRKWLPAVILLVLVGPIRLGVSRLVGTFEPEHVHPTRPLAPLLIALVIEIYLRRRPPTGEGALFNRNLLRLGQITIGASGLAWLQALLGWSSVSDTAFDILMLQGAVAAMAAATLDRRFAMMLLSAAAGIVAALIVPPAAELALGVHLLVTMLVLEHAWDDGRRAPRPPT